MNTESDISMLSKFMVTSSNDPKIGPTHISIYMALLFHWKKNNYETPMRLFSRDVKSLAKISSNDSYYKLVNQLAEYGYIRYVPSFSKISPSLFYIL